MKRTSAIFLLALGLLLSVLGLSQQRGSERGQFALDFDGVDTLQIDRHASIVFSPSVPYAVEYDLSDAPTVSATRQGRALHVHYAVDGYSEPTILAPPGLRTLIVDGANVDAKVSVEDLEVRTTGTFFWVGSAKRLRVLDAGPAGDCGPSCSNTLSINSGKIGELVVSTATGSVDLSQPDGLGQVTLYLGKDAYYSLDHARQTPAIRVVPPTASATPAAVAPASSPQR
jgi:hypothetical protein